MTDDGPDPAGALSLAAFLFTFGWLGFGVGAIAVVTLEAGLGFIIMGFFVPVWLSGLVLGAREINA